MIQKQKNIRLLLAFCILGCSAIILALTGKRYGKSNVNDKEFMVEDTASIVRIEIAGKTFVNTLEKTDDRWMVNKKFPTDPSMIKVLMAVIHEVRVHRRAPKQMVPEVQEKLKSDGFRIGIYNHQGLVRSFIAGGNGSSVSYFMGDDNQPLVVHLPGYNSYVTGIFEVSENDWRDRLILSTSWSGLKKLSLDYPGKKNDGFTIVSSGLIPHVNDIPMADTAIVMDYLEQFEYFSADQYINRGTLRGYDSLSGTVPRAVLKIEAVSLEAPVMIRFYNPLPGDPFIFATIDDSQTVLFSYERIKRVFTTRKHFIKR